MEGEKEKNNPQNLIIERIFEMKKILSLILAVCMMTLTLCINVPIASAMESENEIWDGTVAKSFASGTGTSDDPYVIETAAQLAYFSKAVTTDGVNFSGKYVKLANDIYLNDTSYWKLWSTITPENIWTPIGSDEKPFKGDFNGNNKTIYGIYVNDVEYAGLFGYADSSTIRGVCIKDSFIKSNDFGYAGGIVGYALTTSSTLSMTSIYDCSNYATIVGNYAGGVCGYAGGVAWFKRCSNIGDVNGLGEDSYSGGIVGFFSGYEDSLLYKSFNGGKIEGKRSGGIAGGYYSGFETGYNCNAMGYCNSPLKDLNSSIYWCYNYGNITSLESSGGIVGECNLANKYFSHVSTDERCVQYSYNVGIIQSEGISGQIIGDAKIYETTTSEKKAIYLNKSYYFNPVPSVQYAIGGMSSDSNYATSLSNEKAVLQESYYYFDFEGVWIMDGDEDYMYPKLRDNPHINPHKHSFNSTITTPATHTSTGIMTFTCACGDAYVETIAKIETHSYNAAVTAPTCTVQGYTTYTCECGESYVDDYTDKLNHEYISEITTQPTHLEEGVKTFTCVCGDSYTEPVAKLEGHTYTSEITTQPTHIKEGVKTFTCACGDTYTESVAKTKEHNYVATEVVAPKCEDKGYTVYACQCGNTYKDNFVAEKGHTYSGQMCTTCGENCSCNCHKTGFMGFIWKITLFFNKLFKLNRTCGCGVNHY